MSNTKKNPQRKPDFAIHTKVPDGNGGFKIGSQIGVGFEHNGKESGFNLFMDAMPLPINNRYELVGFRLNKSK